MNDRTWNKLTAADRTRMLESAATMQQQVMAQATAVDAKEIAGMKARGLTVTSFDQQGTADVKAAADALSACMRGTVVPADIYDMAVQQRDAFRKSKSQ